MTCHRSSRLRLFAAMLVMFTAAIATVSCGPAPSTNESEAKPTNGSGPKHHPSTAEALAMVYRGQTLEEILSAPVTQRYTANLIMAFRSTIGMDGGVVLGEVLGSREDTSWDRHYWVLTTDLEAAAACDHVLLGWMRTESSSTKRIRSAETLIECDSPHASEAWEYLLNAVKSRTTSVAQTASLALVEMGPRIDQVAEKLVVYLEQCPQDHTPPAAQTSNFGPTIVHRVGEDVCSEVLMALGNGGPAVDALIPRLTALLAKPKSPSVGILKVLASRTRLDVGVVHAAIECSRSPHDQVREAAAIVLGVAREPATEVSRTLRRLASDDESNVRRAAELAIQKRETR